MYELANWSKAIVPSSSTLTTIMAPMGLPAIAGLPMGALLSANGRMLYDTYQEGKARDAAIAEQNNFSKDMRNIRNTQAQFVPEGNNKPIAQLPQPANNISQPADVIRKRQMWSKPQQRAIPQPRPQMWSQGGAERGYSRNFAEGDDRDGLAEMVMSMPQAESGNPYAQAAAMGNMEQAMSDPTDYNARFYEICRQYGLM